MLAMSGLGKNQSLLKSTKIGWVILLGYGYAITIKLFTSFLFFNTTENTIKKKCGN